MIAPANIYDDKINSLIVYCRGLYGIGLYFIQDTGLQYYHTRQIMFQKGQTNITYRSRFINNRQATDRQTSQTVQVS